MFKNRAITVTMDKKNKTQTEEQHSYSESFEEKTDIVLYKLERLGKKLFVGLCVYIILDTHRQVSVARATNEH